MSHTTIIIHTAREGTEERGTVDSSITFVPPDSMSANDVGREVALILRKIQRLKELSDGD